MQTQTASLKPVLTCRRERSARTSELPLLVKSSVFFFSFVSSSSFFGALVLFSRGVNLGLSYIAHRSLIRVNTVLKVIFPAPSFEVFRECHPATRYIPRI